MARIRQLDDRGPLVVEEGDVDGAVAVCRCGLSDDWPYCDGSHSATGDEEEGAVYAYTRQDGDLERREVTGDLSEALGDVVASPD